MEHVRRNWLPAAVLVALLCALVLMPVLAHGAYAEDASDEEAAAVSEESADESTVAAEATDETATTSEEETETASDEATEESAEEADVTSDEAATEEETATEVDDGTLALGVETSVSVVEGEATTLAFTTGDAGYYGVTISGFSDMDAAEAAWDVTHVYDASGAEVYFTGAGASDEDCTLTYSLEAGTTYTMQIDSSWTATLTVLVKAQKSIEDAEVTLSTYTFTYTGETLHPEVTVVYDGVTLVEGTDYDLGISNGTVPGQATMWVMGSGDYTGSVTVYYTVELDVEIETLTVGSSVTLENSTGGDATKYASFTPSATGFYTFSLTGDWYDVNVYDSGWEVVYQNELQSDTFDLYLAAGETYYVTTSLSDGQTVTLSVENGSGSIIQITQLDTAYSAELLGAESRGMTYYAFTAATAGTFTITLGTSGSGYGWLSLLSSTMGRTDTIYYMYDDESLEVTLEAGETVYLAFYGAATGDAFECAVTVSSDDGTLAASSSEAAEAGSGDTSGGSADDTEILAETGDAALTAAAVVAAAGCAAFAAGAKRRRRQR